jgi:hypothetical protein
VTAKSFADGTSARRAGRDISRRRHGDTKRLRSRWFDDGLRRQAISNWWRIWRTRLLRSTRALQSAVVYSTAMLALPKAVVEPATAPK